MFVFNLEGHDIEVSLEEIFVCFANGSRRSVVKCEETKENKFQCTRVLVV